MWKMSKLITVALFFTLCFSVCVFGGVKSSADGQGGSIVHDYDGNAVSTLVPTGGVIHRVIHEPYLDIEVWVDKGDGATYHPGEDIKIYFRASRDCYVVLYNIDTRGYVNLLYPFDRSDDPYVEGGRTYRIPDRFDEYDLTVDGPSGTEYIQAVASLDPVALPNFPGLSDYDGEIYAYKLDGEDPFEFMEMVNSEIVPYDYASDVCVFSVEYRHPRWYYWPRVVYVDRPVNVVLGGAYFGYPWGMEVWIDGVFYGITPITIPALVVGRHWVTFWYSGCWIWRDWVWIRRDYTIRIWPDCDHRYRYVRERFVEKSYREEKAKRRRGIGDGIVSNSSLKNGFVKRVDFRERKEVAFAEKSRIGETQRLKKEFRAKEKGEVTRYEDEKPQIQKRRQKVDENKSQLKENQIREAEKPKNERSLIQEERKIKAREKSREEKPQSPQVKSVQRQKSEKAQTMKRSETPRAQTKSVNVQKEHKRRK